MRELCKDRHPNIIIVFKDGVFKINVHKYIDMQVCEMNLEEYNYASWKASLVETDIPPDLRANQIWKIVIDIASGLEFLHGRGKVHRDLKPTNGNSCTKTIL